MTAENTANSAAPNTIVLIHGLWMTPLSWEHWIDRYEARGFRVLALAWPGMDGDIDELRSDSSSIEHLGIQEIGDHYAAIIRELDRPPIVMGHSFGGAFTQILLDRSLDAAGVTIDSAAVQGVLRLPWSTLKSGFPVLKSTDEQDPEAEEMRELARRLGRRGGKKGRPARRDKLTPEERSAIAKKAAEARWAKKRREEAEGE
jgi:pimeloyl-ACP methyl ester carboxylesterase